VNPWARATFAARWSAAVQAMGERPFLRFEAPDGSVTDWSYAEFDDLVSRVAGGLSDAGVAPGRAVSLALANSPAFVAVWLAATRLGAWIVPSDPQATAPELQGHLTRTKAALGVCATARADVYRAAAAAAGVPAVEVAEDDTELGGLSPGARRLPADAPRPRPRDRAAVMFTSGTTSAPKGVEVTQANYAFAGDVMAAAAGIGATDRLIVVLPMFHANAQYYSFAAAISVGASVALMSSFSASGFLAQCARHEATHASLFAAPLRMILARGGDPDDSTRRALRLRHCWYAQNVSTEQYDEIARLFGCRPRQLYGMTETIPAVLTNRAVDPVPASMGVPTLGCEVAVHDPAGKACEPGVVGDVVVAGVPGVTLFAGYLDDPVTTAASFSGRWFLTGDRAHVDEDGRCYFDGRQSDVLKVAGENVSVVEVEAVLAEHPSVLEAAVIGEPDPVRDEVPVAFVVARPGGPPLDVDVLAAHCTERLAPSKRPRRITVVDELPRTSVGKIRKFLLRG
jgi:crotonobetaine/carnitine-CoA ligase